MNAHQPVNSVRTFAASSHKLLIDGHWVEAEGGETIDVFDPATEERIAIVPRGAAKDIDRAVKAARRSFETASWRGLKAEDRAAIMWRFADLIEKNATELADLDILNNGMPRYMADGMVKASANWMRFYAGSATRIFGRDASGAISGGGQQMHAYTMREPIGVAGLILPWNGPVGVFVVKVAPALAAGCSVVVKPAENTPLSALRLGQLAVEAGVPDGVINIVTGYGDAGQALVDHPLVDKISFTGSTDVGKRIVDSASGNLKRITLELGGKSPCLLFGDADMDVAIPGAAMSTFLNSGQVCWAGSRLLIEKKAYDKVLAGITDFANNLKVGNGFDPSTNLGPLISAKQRDRVVRYMEIGQEEGAEIVAGGPSDLEKGFFVKPTVLANVNANARVMREEIFGPVISATPVDDVDEMIRIANDTNYGLAACLFTSDVNRTHQIASRIRAGTVWVNCFGVNHITMPFGGYKESGWGRELGDEALDNFLETKSVFVQLR
ncbi:MULTISPECIES: aldehyde dehydrogenase family protein [Sphingobium]|uniref:aldehyde dehydrogenase family protein n=1 Tax=Sphingobium TaxID=165695 RepID=UPI00159C9B14|nr:MULTISPECIES: aldehyde dehydrogenase family protein [unclassified Sphingobium]